MTEFQKNLESLQKKNGLNLDKINRYKGSKGPLYFKKFIDIC